MAERDRDSERRRRRAEARRASERARSPERAGSAAGERSEDSGRSSAERSSLSAETDQQRSSQAETDQRVSGSTPRPASPSRRARRAPRAGGRSKGAAADWRLRAKQGLAALREGGSETRKQLRGRPSQASRLAGTAGSRARTILGGLFAGLVTLVGAVVGFARGPLGEGLVRAGRLVAAAAVVVTPARGLAVAAIGCALLLGLSQFVDYRGVSVGGAEFLDDTGTVAPPPEVDRREAGEPHNYAFLPLAVLAAAILALAYARKRWQLTRVAVLVGIAALLVSIFIDRPQGLDEGTTSRDFAGAEAKLLAGFWAQLFAGLGLAGTSLMLGQELRSLAGSRATEREPSRRMRWPKRGTSDGGDSAGPRPAERSTQKGAASESRKRGRTTAGEGSA